MHKFTLFILLLLLSTSAIGQTLKTSNLDLNPGGVIYDVAFDAYSNAYVVVGDFNSIQGVSRNNLAFIDATTFTVQSEAPISSINGAIRTIAITRNFLFPMPNQNYLYLGGDFTSINGQNRLYLCQFRKVEPISPPFNSSYVFSSTWDAEIFNNFSPSDKVNDLLVKGDTIVAVGRFSIYTGISSYATYDLGGVLSFEANKTTLDPIAIFSFYNNGNTSTEHYQIEYFDHEFLITHESDFLRFDESGVFIDNFTDCNTNQAHRFSIHPTTLDTVFVSQVEFAGGSGIALYLNDGTLYNCPVSTPNPYVLLNGSTAEAEGYTAVYEQQIFVAEQDGILSYQRSGLNPIQPASTISANLNWYPDITNDWRPQRIQVVENKLFVFGENLTQLDGQPHSGLAAVCLPPQNALPFTNADTVVCEEEIANYSIPPAEFAEGYQWTFTGAGAAFRIAGSNNPFQPLVNNYVNGLNANSIEIHYPNGSSGGVLTVAPYSTCNSATDYLTAQGQSINIQVVPRPDISMPDSAFLNCFSDSAWIVLNSSTANVSSLIFRDMDSTFNDSLLHAAPLSPLFTPGYYFGMVTEPINMCTNMDSTWFSVDTVPPTIPVGFATFNPPVFDCNTSQMTVNGSVPNATLYWEYSNDPTLPLPNPFNVYSTDSIDFKVFATDLSNGCTREDSLFISVDTSIAQGGISGYGTINFPLDTISCLNPSLSLTCEAIDGTATWMETGTSQLNIATIDSLGMNNNIQIYTYETTHNATGCTDQNQVVLYFDLDPPSFIPYSGVSSINCSQSSVELIHQNSGNALEGWLNDMGVQTNLDTIIATSIGEYYYQVQGDNGCLSTDTVTVEQTTDMIITMPNDTLICPNESVLIEALPSINTGESPIFLWSDGSTSNTGTAVGSTDSLLTVIVQTASGCLGYDTTIIAINPPIEAYFSSSSGCISASIEVDSIFGGNGNYEYSLDQLNWQITPVFSGLNNGSIDIFVRDDLGCIYTFSETINPSGNSPEMDILSATYNDLGDTAVALSFGTSLAFDSLEWMLPGIATVVFESDSLIAFSIDSEGWYDVTLIGYQDTCQYAISESVYFGSKPIFDSSTVNNGILSFTVSPNPTFDTFEINAEFGTSQSYTILVNSLEGQAIADFTRTGTGSIVLETLSFSSVNAAAGTYVIHLIGQHDAEQILIIKN